MSTSTLYTEVFIEHFEDGFRNRIYEVDGVIGIDYQEYVDKDGNPACGGKKGEWKTKSQYDGLFMTSEIDQYIKALLIVSRGAE